MSADEKKSAKFPEPSYEEVCSGKTGHVEVCEVEFDSSEVSVEELLKVFWRIHNPTTRNRQGLDIGFQYKSVIFYHNLEQKKISEKSLNLEQKNYRRKIKTEILPVGKFCKAEEYHQDYLNKKNLKSCGI